MKKKLLAAGALLAMALFGSFDASAALLYEASTDGGTSFASICSAASGTGATGCSGFTVLSNGLFVVASPVSDSPGTPALATLATQTTIENTNTSGTATVEFLIGDTDFTSPVTPPALNFASSISGNVVQGSGLSNSLSFFSCIDQADGQNVCPGSFSTPPLTPDITNDGSVPLSTSSIVVSSLSAPYSITEEVTLTLSAGNAFSFDASTALTPAVTVAAPAPLIGSGLPVVLAVGGILFGAKLLQRGNLIDRTAGRRLP